MKRRTQEVLVVIGVVILATALIWAFVSVVT